MFHPYRKDSSYLRAAIFKSYKEKCAYCGRTIQQRDMHIDHIIPSNRQEKIDDEVRDYLIELQEKGFVVDSIENYLPSYPACNIGKTNRIFTSSNLRFYHEKVRGHIAEILKIIEGLKETKETFYEPVYTGIWEEIDFSYQRDLSHAIMGYRLTPADVEVCPRFPQVEKIKKLLSIVDYTVIEGETGCGKSISIYQAAYDFYQDGWRVYQCKETETIDSKSIRDNTELSLYIIDDAQQLSEKLVDALKKQARPNAKILFAKTISSVVKQDTILLSNKEAVELIYSDFVKKKEEIVPIVHKFDKSIGMNFLDHPIERHSLIWSKEDLRHLVDRMIVLSEDDVRIVHMESAKIIIALFFKGSSESKKQVLLSFIEKVFDTPYEKNGKYFFLQHKKIFLEWIQNADSETAYAYSRFINTLINTDIKLHREFVRQINWTRLQESMIQENKSNLYSWGKLYNRLLYSLPKKEYLSVGKMLENAIEKFCDSVSVLNIEDLTCFLCSVMHINSDYVHKTVEKLIPIYATYFKKDMSQAIYLFDFDFLGYVCGLDLLGGHRTTSVEKKSAKLIVSVIPEKEFAEVIMKCQPRDWHTVHPIMDLIGRYDREKAKGIIDIVDVSSLAERTKDSWRRSHEITELCDILYIGNYNVAQRFIKSNLDNIQTMYSSFIMMSPKCAIEAFDRGIKIDLLTEHWWSVSLYALQGLNKTDVEKTKEILLESVSQIIERINSITALDFDEKYFLKFLKLIKAIDSEIFGMIVLKLDITKIDNNWSKGAIRRGKEKQVKKRREQFYELIKQ